MTTKPSPKNPDHGKLMRLLCERTGKITDGAAQGKAANDLISGMTEQRFTFEDIVAELDLQLKQARTKGHWREGQRVSLLTVVKVMGTKYDQREVETLHEVEQDTLSLADARELVAALHQTDPINYSWHINMLCELYNLPVPIKPEFNQGYLTVCDTPL